jgi:hypothetical protein
MNTTDNTIATPESFDWGNEQLAAIRAEKKLIAAACQRKDAAEKVVNHWLDKMKREWIEGNEVGIVNYAALRKERYDDDGNSFSEFDGSQIFDAIMLMSEKGWEVQPRYARVLLVFNVLIGITIRQAPDGYQPSSAFHQRWTKKLKAGWHISAL